MKYFFFVIFLFLSSNLFSKSYAFVNLNFLIENNPEYLNFLEDLNHKETKYKEQLEEKEKNLIILKNQIDTGSLILTEVELQNMINDYNFQREEFNEKLKQIKAEIENNLIEARKLMLLKIRNILVEISQINNYDFILDENNILIVDNELDITKEVSLLLNETSIQLQSVLNK